MTFGASCSWQPRQVEDLARLSIKNKPVYVGVDDAEQESTVDGLEQVRLFIAVDEGTMSMFGFSPLLLLLQTRTRHVASPLIPFSYPFFLGSAWGSHTPWGLNRVKVWQTCRSRVCRKQVLARP